ncbi:ankyrin repeats (3 copies) domain-containing protein [Pochonia chlamydosporia 170]|uniref:Ankyrin repeats (3 copies) domain-containing protein n=1 Tax=Pochonia chlamydosporia 170 TaxID=1380566 RepID=A0A219ANX6_METCM|nr:ankyrin repeats (3 copies) domain-containing protein [Pochonia chlamydosporia 170]OWT42262.1 ankyrin repeats (3 copies) domain-containing protein [Pochonia chlamydosporia 170]
MSLLSHQSVEPDRRDYYGSTPLSIAVRNNRIEIVKLLLATGQVTLDSRDTFGRTVLWWAGRSGSPDMEQTLLNYSEERGIPVCKNNAFINANLMSNDKISTWCDVCTLNIPNHQVSYQCHLCNGGDFYICSECYEIGGRCLGDDHVLV